MRSYSYAGGIWQPSTDILPPTATEPSLFSKPSPQWNAFKEALEQRGFSTSSSVFTCLSGFLWVYARDHSKLKAKRQEQEYDFLATMSLAHSWVRVWIVDLPNMLSFLREVNARAVSSERSLAEVVEEAWQKIFHDEDVQSLVLNAKHAFDKLSEGKIEITVKPPKPQRQVR